MDHLFAMHSKKLLCQVEKEKEKKKRENKEGKEMVKMTCSIFNGSNIRDLQQWSPNLAMSCV